MPGRTATRKKSAQDASPHRTSVAVLSGGAPNGALTAGALAAIYDAGKTFTTIYASGAGAMVGMLYAGPRKGMTTVQALESVKGFGIDDAIYGVLPVGYKTFFKSSPFTETWIKWAQLWKRPVRDPDDRLRRIYNDLVDLVATATCPLDLTFFSKGLCGDFPFLKDFVDFKRIQQSPAGFQFFMNAFSIEDQQMVVFDKTKITPDHFDAALSYPFIYPPKLIDGKHYFEGGCIDPLNLTSLGNRIDDGEIEADTVVLIDILGALGKVLIRVPNDLWDAYGISIMMPVVALAQKNEEIFRIKNLERPVKDQVELLKVTFDIDPTYAHVTDWSVSNMQTCWEIGRRAGREFVAKYGHRLPDRVDTGPEPRGRRRDSRAASRRGSATRRALAGALEQR